MNNEIMIKRVEAVQRRLPVDTAESAGGDPVVYQFVLRLHLLCGDRMRTGCCSWEAPSGWRDVARLAEVITGLLWLPSQERAEAFASRIGEIAGEGGLGGEALSATSALLEAMLRDEAGREDNSEEFVARVLPGFMRYLSSPAANPDQSELDTGGWLTIQRAQAIQCWMKDGAGSDTSEEGAQFLFILQLKVEMPDGSTLEWPIRWHANRGWTGVEAAIKRLPGRRLSLHSDMRLADLADCVGLVMEGGFPKSGRAALSSGLAQLIGVATNSGAEQPAPLEYATFMRGVNRYACVPEPPMPSWQGKPMNIYEGVTYLHPLGGNGAKGHLLERQALAYGLSTLRYNKGTFLATDGVHEPLNFKWSRSPISSCVSLSLCTHKEATRARLSRAGVPVPRGRMFVNGDFESAYLYADRIGYPVVCKPAAGVRGIGVVANIQNQDELREAFRQMSASRLGGDDFIVEKHVSGRDYRIVVLDGEVVAAILREPASVMGDGKRNVAELVMHKNAIRRLNPHLWARPAKYDDAMKFQLKRAGLSLDSVPDAGQVVMLSNTCSLSQGGDSIDILDELHPTIRDAAVAAVKAIPGLRYCGVDFLIEDHAAPLEGQSAGICELNAHAAIGNCEYPLFGTPREVARSFLHRCATTYGLNISEKPAEKLAIRIRVRGRVTRVGYRRWLKAQAERFGVKGWVQNFDSRCVEALLVGDTAPVTAMASGAVLGPSRSFPTSVQTEHVPWEELDGFEIKSGYAGNTGNGA